MTLPEVIPLFPLPNVVLFPRLPLPLHVFEPRYRDLVRDAVRGPRLIGLILLREGWQRDYHGAPPIFSEGTVGEIAHLEELPDGRSNIILRGLREFRVLEEPRAGTAYRQARVAWREPPADGLPAGVRDAIGSLVRRYLDARGRASGELFEHPLDDEVFVNFFAQHLDVPPVEKQAMLEAPTLADRARRLRDVLEFRLEELRLHPGAPSSRAH